MNRFSRLALVASIPVISLGFSSAAFASGGQSFMVGSYPNAAAMMFVKRNTLSFGGSILQANINFKGSVGGSPRFSADSEHGIFSPTFKAYHRLNKYVIVGLAGFEPGVTFVGFGNDSPAAFANDYTNLRSYDLSPSLTIQPFKWLAFAVGPDAMYRHGDVDVMVRTPLAPNGSTLYNHASGWSARWHAAVMAALSKGTFVGLSFYSRSTTHLEGVSTYLGFRSNDANADIYFPATYTLSITQFLSPKWVVQGKVDYSEWNKVGQTLIIHDIALPGAKVIAPLNYHATWHYSLFTRYNITPKYALEGVISRDYTPTNNRNRSLQLPEGNLLSLGIGGQVKVKKHLAVEGLVGYGFFTNTVRLNKAATTSPSQVGKADLDLYWGAFDIVYKD